ncbi:hypothetical protein [Macrococcus armenti]|uniref:hypothetical protein n=1 Tax=Macrococcus armenti TaxID=2875764 RepID=UPI001CC97F13|nr:hypothetical protein [Macrococcus armenti]UBH14411.1 hypothetical protein LAU44_06375 [Macrococcus armenti]UBH16771.1 hypothetical protein LAU39_06390 [Macrococcus armenti]UBH19034.1 hypothetical protein LAU40_06380 [Macrococcus armenti]
MNNTIKLIIASLLSLVPLVGIASIVYLIIGITKKNFPPSAITWVILGVLAQVLFIYSGINSFRIFDLENVQPK